MSFTYDHADNAPGEAVDPVSQATTRNRQWCERVATTMDLSPDQLDDLKQLVNVSCLDYAIALPEFLISICQLASAHDSSVVRLFIWQQATQYRILNTIIKRHVDLERLMNVLHDVEDHLGTAWKVSEELKVCSPFIYHCRY